MQHPGLSSWRRGSYAVLTVLLPTLIVATWAFGYLFPNLRDASIGVGIGVGLTVLFVSWIALSITDSVLSRIVWGVPLLLACFLVAFGLGDAGPDSALEQAGERVDARVTSVDVEVNEWRDSEGRRQKSMQRTYMFERVDNGEPLGPYVYNGSPGPEGFRKGSEVSLLVDPSGDLPLQPYDDVDSRGSLIVGITGGVGWFLIWVLGIFTYPRRYARWKRREDERSGRVRHQPAPIVHDQPPGGPHGGPQYGNPRGQ